MPILISQQLYSAQEPGELCRSKINITENSPQCPTFQRLSSVNRDRRAQLMPRQDMVASANSYD